MIIRLLLLVNLLFISLNSYAEISRPGIDSQSTTTIYSTVFVTLLLVIITSNLAKSGQSQLALRIDRWSRIIFPSMLTMVTLVSFL